MQVCSDQDGEKMQVTTKVRMFFTVPFLLECLDQPVLHVVQTLFNSVVISPEADPHHHHRHSILTCKDFMEVSPDHNNVCINISIMPSIRIEVISPASLVDPTDLATAEIQLPGVLTRTQIDILDQASTFIRIQEMVMVLEVVLVMVQEVVRETVQEVDIQTVQEAVIQTLQRAVIQTGENVGCLPQPIPQAHPQVPVSKLGSGP